MTPEEIYKHNKKNLSEEKFNNWNVQRMMNNWKEHYTKLKAGDYIIGRINSHNITRGKKYKIRKSSYYHDMITVDIDNDCCICVYKDTSHEKENNITTYFTTEEDNRTKKLKTII